MNINMNNAEIIHQEYIIHINLTILDRHFVNATNFIQLHKQYNIQIHKIRLQKLQTLIKIIINNRTVYQTII